MKRQILLLAITAAALSSCTTAYKSGQTPDDVYFSPARPQDEYVQVKEKDEYRYDDGYYDDRYLRMKVQNRTRWDYLDDWYSYDRYGYRYDYYYGTYYNPYTSWNYYYNPYCRNNVVIYNPKQTNRTAYVAKPRNFSLGSYTNTSYNTSNNNGVRMNSIKPGTVNRPTYNNTNSNNRSLSNTVKEIFNNNNSSNNSNAPTRTYTPSSSGSSGSSSSGSSGSSSGGTKRPGRGN